MSGPKGTLEACSEQAILRGATDTSMFRRFGLHRESLAASLFLAPNFLGFLVFTSLPIVAALALSLCEWDPIAAPLSQIQFVGPRNFVNLLGFHHGAYGWEANDPDFWQFAGNTLFLMLAIPVSMGLSLSLALALNQKLRGITVFRTVFFIPSIAAGVGTMVLWIWVFNPQYGPINMALRTLGMRGPNWLQDYYWAKPSLMLMGLATGVGGTNTVLYLAGLQDVSRDLYEAATLDGAGSWAKFLHVTWPALRPVTFFIFVMSLIEGFQGGFDAGYVMTAGGPDGATTTLSFYVWREAFQYFHLGYAAAIAVVLFTVILAATVLSWRHGKEAVTA